MKKIKVNNLLKGVMELGHGVSIEPNKSVEISDADYPKHAATVASFVQTGWASIELAEEGKKSELVDPDAIVDEAKVAEVAAAKEEIKKKLAELKKEFNDKKTEAARKEQIAVEVEELKAEADKLK